MKKQVNYTTETTDDETVLEMAKSALAKLSVTTGATIDAERNLTAALKTVYSPLQTNHSQADALECVTLDMLKALQPDRCGKDGFDQKAYRTFSTTFVKMVKPGDETEERDILPGYTLSIKLEKIDKNNKDKEAPRKFVVGASHTSVERHALKVKRDKADADKAETRAAEDKKMVKLEEIAARINQPTAERDTMVLESVFEMFPDKPALDTLRELMERTITDTVLDEKAA